MIRNRTEAAGLAARAVLVGLGYYLAFLGGMSLSTPVEDVVLLWPPNAVLLSALLLTPRRKWWAFCLAVIPAAMLAGLSEYSVFQALVLAGVNVSECLMAGWLVRRFVPRIIFGSLRSVFFFGLFSAGFASCLGALLTAVVFAVFRPCEESCLILWRLLWFQDSLGLMVLTPLFVSWAERRNAVFSGIGFRLSEAVSCCLMGLGASILCFSLHVDMVQFFALTPILLIIFPLWAAVRFGVEMTTLVSLIVAAPVVWFTSHGLGPYGVFPDVEAALKVQELLATIVFASLAISGLIQEVARKTQSLELTQKALKKLNVELEQRVARRTRQLEEVNLQLAQLANTDALTETMNRRAFLEQAELEIVRHARYDRPLSMIMFDLDHFKRVNDTYGHGVGDDVLRLLARTVRNMIRPSDLFGRIGGEEFVLLLPEQGCEAATSLAERLRAAVEKLSVSVEGGEVGFTISLGVQELAPGTMDVATGLRLTDEKMYEAKRQGRNRVVAG